MAFFLNSFTLTHPGFSIACFLWLPSLRKRNHASPECLPSKARALCIQVEALDHSGEHPFYPCWNRQRSSFSFFVILTMKQSKQLKTSRTVICLPAFSSYPILPANWLVGASKISLIQSKVPLKSDIDQGLTWRLVLRPKTIESILSLELKPTMTSRCMRPRRRLSRLTASPSVSRLAVPA